MDAGADWSDFESRANALDNTSTQDCATACKALESLSRAAQHICEVAPDQCDAAKARLKNATDRVHAACPSCEVRAGAGAAAQQPMSDHENTVVVERSAPHGGCGGCATSSRGDALAGSALSLLLLAGIGWRRRRRDHLRRVRDALRVEADSD
jgi:MYXO-CTERM domain-containing protein